LILHSDAFRGVVYMLSHKLRYWNSSVAQKQREITVIVERKSLK